MYVYSGNSERECVSMYTMEIKRVAMHSERASVFLQRECMY